MARQPTLSEVVQLQGAAFLYLRELKQSILNQSILASEFENAEVVIMFTNVDSCRIVLLTTTELSPQGLTEAQRLRQAVSDMCDMTWRGVQTRTLLVDRIRQDFPLFKER